VLKRRQVLLAHHAAIAHEHHATKVETLHQVGNHGLHRRRIDRVAFPNVMGDRPARDHHQADDHLHVLRLAVAAVAVPSKILGPRSFEVSAGDVVEHQFGLQTEEIAKPAVQRDFQLALGGDQPVERAIPGLQLAEIDLNAISLMPVRHEASSESIADEVVVEPAGQAVLAGGSDQAIGDEHEEPIGIRNASGVVAFAWLAEKRVQDWDQAELLEERTDDQDGPPGPGLEDVDIRLLAGNDGIAAEHANEIGEELLEQVFASEVSDDALLDLAVLSEGFDDADVLVDGAVGEGDFDGADEHGVSITTEKEDIKMEMDISEKQGIFEIDLGKMRGLMSNMGSDEWFAPTSGARVRGDRASAGEGRGL